MGHKSVASTQVYAKLSDEQLRKAILKLKEVTVQLFSGNLSKSGIPYFSKRCQHCAAVRMHRLIVENRKGSHTKSICLFLFPIEQKSVVVGFVTIDGILG